MDRVVSVCRRFEVNPITSISRPAQLTATWLLQRAGTFVSRPAAIHAALQLGMPLNAVEQYLDCLEQTSPSRVLVGHSTPGVS
jgi:hypothetical protein